MEKDIQFMNQALVESFKCLDKNILPVGTVLVVDGQIVARAHKSEENSYHLDHAEIVLVREYFKAKNIARGVHDVILYTTLEPCMMCLGTILHLPINRLVFAAFDPYGGGCCIMNYPKQLPFRHQKNKLEIVSGICELESKQQILTYFKNTDKDFYKDINNPLVSYIKDIS